MSNKKIAEYITSNMECINLLELLGFSEQEDVLSESEGL